MPFQLKQNENKDFELNLVFIKPSSFIILKEKINSSASGFAIDKIQEFKCFHIFN